MLLLASFLFLLLLPPTPSSPSPWHVGPGAYECRGYHSAGIILFFIHDMNTHFDQKSPIHAFAGTGQVDK